MAALTWPDTAHPGDGNHVADHNLLATNGEALESRVIDLEALPAAALSTDAGQQATTGTDHGILVSGLALATDLAAKVDTTDPRLSDTRTPKAHAASHGTGQADAITIAPAQVTGTAVITTDARLSDARTPTAHKASHATGGSDALTAADVGALGTGQAFGSIPISGQLIQPFMSYATLTAKATNEGTQTFVPVFVQRACSLDRLGILVLTTAGSTGCVARLGIYNASPTTGLPSTVLVDAGTVNTTTTGEKLAVVSVSLSQGLYWLSCATQGGATTRHAYGSGEIITGILPTSPGTSAGACSLYQTGITGAFDVVSAGSLLFNSSSAPRVYGRVV